jgi:hypothetical protein
MVSFFLAGKAAPHVMACLKTAALSFLERHGNAIKEGFDQVVHEGSLSGLDDDLHGHPGLEVPVA